MLIQILKSSFIFQNLASWLYAAIPCVVSHNLQKYEALKRSLYLTAMEQLDGDYLEFGVFTGSSFVFSARMHKKLAYLGKVKTRFFGFDSFSGFGDVKDHDRHPFYIDSIFSVNANKVIGNIKRKTKGLHTEIIQGLFEDTIKGKKAREFGIAKARIVFIDCDLKDPAAQALAFAKDAIQSGTILVMDDFYSYKGNPKLGVAGAFSEFCRANPHITWQRVFDYGYGGIAFIATVDAP